MDALNFNRLLKRYLDKTATDAELNEFYTLLLTGQYDHLFNNAVLEGWKDRQLPASADEALVLEEISARILPRR